MAADCSVKIDKHMTWRGDPLHTWSNRYYLSGHLPSSTAEWDALFDGLVLLEKTLYNGGVIIDRAVGYSGVANVPTASKAYSTAGTGSFSGSNTPPECAVIMRMATTKTSSLNRPVYVFSYYHRAERVSAGAAGDELAPAQQTAVMNFGTALITGVTIGANTYKRSTPDGHLVTGRSVDPFIGHRDFPR
jgi:hypothetical protein